MHAVTVQFPAASGQLIGEAGCVIWHSSYETSGSSSAQYSLWDGEAAAGNRLMVVTLSGGQSTRDYIKIHHLPFYQGLYWSLDSGAAAGNVIVQIAHNCLAAWRIEAAKLEAEYEALVAPGEAPRQALTAENVPTADTIFQPGPSIPQQ